MWMCIRVEAVCWTELTLCVLGVDWPAPSLPSPLPPSIFCPCPWQGGLGSGGRTGPLLFPTAQD